MPRSNGYWAIRACGPVHPDIATTPAAETGISGKETPVAHSISSRPDGIICLTEKSHLWHGYRMLLSHHHTKRNDHFPGFFRPVSGKKSRPLTYKPAARHCSPKSTGHPSSMRRTRLMHLYKGDYHASFIVQTDSRFSRSFHPDGPSTGLFLRRCRM
jgi:hypothetical protein